MPKPKRGSLRSTEPQARKVLEEIHKMMGIKPPPPKKKKKEKKD